jgi:hypothetical protein
MLMTEHCIYRTGPLTKRTEDDVTDEISRIQSLCGSSRLLTNADHDIPTAGWRLRMALGSEVRLFDIEMDS